MLFAILLHLWTTAKRAYLRRRPRTALQRRRCGIVVVVLAVVAAVVSWITPVVPVLKSIFERAGIHCDEDKAINFIDELCHNYSRHYVVGSLCPALCSPATVPAADPIRRLTFKRCLSHGNKVVIGLTMTKRHRRSGVGGTGELEVGESVVLKASHYSGEGYRQIIDGPLGGISLKEAFDLFQDELVHSAKPYSMSSQSTLQFLQDYNLLPRNASLTYRPSAAELHSMWSLVEQAEFKQLVLLQETRGVPTLLGSCGHAYVVSSRPTPSTFNLVRSPHVPWQDRVRLALGFIALERRLSSSQYGALHMCDVQEGNFGIEPPSCRDDIRKRHMGVGLDRFHMDEAFMHGSVQRGRQDQDPECRTEFNVAAIDIDMSFFGGRMKEILGEPRCDSDEECDFFDCKAYCDKWRRKCVDTRANSNVQAICKNIFIGFPRIKGLLWNSPLHIRQELQAA